MHNLSTQREQELVALQQRINELEARQKATADALKSSHLEIERLKGLQSAQANELATIHSSLMWRVLLRGRSAFSWMPPQCRRLIRRMAKAGWWAVTPWRMLARLRYLRERGAIPLIGGTAGPRSAISYVPSLDMPHTQRMENGQVAASGRYVLADGTRAYTYIPPRMPQEVDGWLRSLIQPPRFSIVVPVYNTPPLLLDKLVRSVLGQWYPHWELILVNDNSSEGHVREDLDRLADPRIVVVHLTENKRISLATNEGIARATGDYIVFADHDDELTADCLYELAASIERDDPDFIYSDEDKIDESGRYVEPFFKPDWSPDTLMSTMYTCHVSCVRRELVNAIGGLRPEYDGAQDWDFILRVVERTRRITHIPKVLYHWRIIPASVASDLNAKPYAISAGKRAREAAMERRGLAGDMESVDELPGYFRAVYRLRGNPKISIVIPSKNNQNVLKQCIDSIESMTSYENFEIVLIDNGSSDPGTLQYVDGLRSNTRVRVLSYDKPFNYSAINNLGAAEASGELLVFLNDDTEVLVPDWLERLAGYAQLPHMGAVGAKLLYPGGERVQHVGIVNLSCGPGHAFLGIGAGTGGSFARALLEYNWLAVTGACLMVERAKFEQVGRFDENLPVAYNDVDLCFRLVEAGFYNLVNTAVKLIHHESYSRGSDDVDPVKKKRLKQEMQMLYLKHPGFYQHDPFHNPNLSPHDVWFGLSH